MAECGARVVAQVWAREREAAQSRGSVGRRRLDRSHAGLSRAGPSSAGRTRRGGARAESHAWGAMSGLVDLSIN
jgi:hypothetical protein